MLCYAESGVGKTALCATAPTPILISAESGLLSLAEHNLEKIHGVAAPGVSYDIPVITVSSVEDLNEAYAWLLNSAESKPFETVCVDSLTEIGEVVLARAKSMTKDPRQAYGELIEKMTILVKGFRDLPGRNVYMSAKVEPLRDELTGITKYSPAMPGSKLGPQLPYLFDEVFRLAVGVDKETNAPFRYIQTQPDLQFICKDRSGSLEPWEAPNLTTIINKITRR
jgi:hypothetical protein